MLKVFTLEDGLISLMGKSGLSSALTSPFCIAEWVYRKRNSEMYTLHDGSLIDGLLELRQNYETLSAAGQIAQDLLRSQLPSKKNQSLYALTSSYFKTLPYFSKPEILVASFRLKFLLHEGLLSLQETCCCCALPASHLFQGESFCLKHGPTPGLSFDSEEWRQVQTLSFSRTFSKLQNVTTHPQDKIRQLFQERLSH